MTIQEAPEFPSATDSQSIQLYMEQSSQRNSETGVVTPTHQVTEKITSKWEEKAETHFCHKLHPDRDTIGGGGTNSQLLPKE